MKFIAFYIILFLFNSSLFAQFSISGAETVREFKPGKGQNIGQEAVYFPRNVLGMPDSTARNDIAITRPESICSLGLGGEIILGWETGVLIDAPGNDFYVFENAFEYSGTRVYAEPAKIAVSKNGIDFVEFPFDSLTLRGCAGTEPTNGLGVATLQPEKWGGNGYDLREIGIDSVRWIKITDISSIVKNNRQHPFWDPTISGFDLDAVVAVHLLRTNNITNIARNSNFSIIRQSEILRILPKQPQYFDCGLYSYSGELITSQSGNDAFINLSSLSNGIYYISMSNINLREGFLVQVFH